MKRCLLAALLGALCLLPGLERKDKKMAIAYSTAPDFDGTDYPTTFNTNTNLERAAAFTFVAGASVYKISNGNVSGRALVSQSSDGGKTWTNLDELNGPLVFGGMTQYYDEGAGEITIAYRKLSDDSLALSTFNLGTGLWGSEFANDPSYEIERTLFLTVRSGNWYVILRDTASPSLRLKSTYWTGSAWNARVDLLNPVPTGASSTQILFHGARLDPATQNVDLLFRYTTFGASTVDHFRYVCLYPDDSFGTQIELYAQTLFGGGADTYQYHWSGQGDHPIVFAGALRAFYQFNGNLRMWTFDAETDCASVGTSVVVANPTYHDRDVSISPRIVGSDLVLLYTSRQASGARYDRFQIINKITTADGSTWSASSQLFIAFTQGLDDIFALDWVDTGDTTKGIDGYVITFSAHNNGMWISAYTVQSTAAQYAYAF